MLGLGEMGKYLAIQVLIFLSLSVLAFHGCRTHHEVIDKRDSKEPFTIEKVISDTLFDSIQKAVLVRITTNTVIKPQWNLAYSQTERIFTSRFALEGDADIAINGGFFDMQKGGSVTYLEVDGKPVTDRFEGQAKGSSSAILDGALVITSGHELEVEYDKGPDYYALSDNERAVLITGPVLLLNGDVIPLPETPFVTDRHPRSAVCIDRNDDVIMFAIDGRRPEAEGMSLNELQAFMKRKGCHDAINLDGGGSTTLWSRKEGILNTPSDPFGERPVANAIFVKVR